MSDRRAILLVMDGCGIGRAIADCGSDFEPEGSTLPHIAEVVGGLRLPALKRLGLGRIANIRGLSPVDPVTGAFGACRVLSAGKDSVTGHWEMAGVETPVPFPTYPQGFPEDVIADFEDAIGRPVLGNVVASGTEVIQCLGAEHLASGRPIVYTSVDSVFQLAAHESAVPVETLYHWCEIARALLKEPHNVQRVIARPFAGSESGGFHRTERRRDFPLPVPPGNLISVLAAAGQGTHAIGVVAELFPGAPLSRAERTQSNSMHLAALRRASVEGTEPFVFANCEDFDMLYGHRNDPKGFAIALEEFDIILGDLLTRLRPGDLLIITADHGNDPTTPSTDHSREDVPLLVFTPSVDCAIALGLRFTLADIAATVAAWLGVAWSGAGKALKAGDCTPAFRS